MGVIFSCIHELTSLKPAADEQKKSTGQQDATFAAAAVAAVIASDMKREKGRSARAVEDALIQEAAKLILLQQLQKQNGGGRAEIPFDRSASLKYPGTGGRKPQGMRRSSSSRQRSVADAVVRPDNLLNQEIQVDELETNHFVLVHGGGFGAWCWYKTIALLEDAGFKVNAIDLTGSGVHSFDTNNITSLTQYAKPLTNFLEKLDDTADKVILVGHDFGGACISHAMEAFPTKIAKAVFVAAAMPKDGQSTLDMFSQQEGASDLMRQAQIFLYENDKDQPPTSIDLDKSLLKELLFNQSPIKDIALASVSMRPIPFAPMLQKLVLTDSNYGSVRRFYIETANDNAISPSLQQNMCDSNHPEKVFHLKGSDHSPFFSKPQALHRLLVEIAKIPANQP